MTDDKLFCFQRTPANLRAAWVKMKMIPFEGVIQTRGSGWCVERPLSCLDLAILWVVGELFG